MIKFLPKFILVVCVLGLITGCVSKSNHPAQVTEVEIHFSGSFHGQQVVCKIDDQTLFRKKLTRGKLFDLAHQETASVAGDKFNIEIEIDGYGYSYDLNTVAGKYIVFRLHDNGNDVQHIIILGQSADSPAYE